MGALCLCVDLSFTPCLCCRAQSASDAVSFDTILGLFRHCTTFLLTLSSASDTLSLCLLPILPPPPNQPYTSPPPLMCPQDKSVDRANPGLRSCKESDNIISCQWQYTAEFEKGPFESLYWIGVCVRVRVCVCARELP